MKEVAQTVLGWLDTAVTAVAANLDVLAATVLGGLFTLAGVHIQARTQRDESRADRKAAADQAREERHAREDRQAADAAALTDLALTDAQPWSLTVFASSVKPGENDARLADVVAQVGEARAALTHVGTAHHDDGIADAARELRGALMLAANRAAKLRVDAARGTPPHEEYEQAEADHDAAMQMLEQFRARVRGRTVDDTAEETDRG